MKLICNGIDLADSFNKVSKALTGKNTIQILEGIKLSAIGDQLTLTASDTDITIENTIKATIMLEGEIVVPGKLTGELIRKMSSQQIELEALGNGVLNIKYLDSESKINLYNIEEYPVFNNNSYDITFNMLQRELKDMINKTIFAAATDENRPILKGCLMNIEGDKISCVAIDGLRLAIARKTLDRDYGAKKLVIPSKTLLEVSKLIEDNDDIIIIKANAKKVLFDMNHTKVTASLLEGEFINHERIIPKNVNTEVNIITEQLSDGLDRASIISRNVQSNLIKIEISDSVMTIYSKAEIGDITEKVTVSMKGKDIKLALNSKFITDCLRAINDEYIKFSFSSSTEPCTITPLEGDAYLYLILPVRVMS